MKSVKEFSFPDKNDPLEKVIETKVCTYAKKRGFLAYKFVSPNNRGVPDRIFISPEGSVFFIEFKRKGRKPTKLQHEIITRLQKHNAFVDVVDNIEDGKEFIDKVLYAELCGLKVLPKRHTDI